MLDWAPENGVSYNVTSVPLAGVAFNGSTSVQLTLLYNTQYNVSILATLCGQSNTAIAVHRNLDFGESVILYHILNLGDYVFVFYM